ncbi:MAG: PAS domain-containing protein [Planctomycetota bacterium]|nr:MAG: PAS domain-containing protein [Planctomycetota bacterium]
MTTRGETDPQRTLPGDGCAEMAQHEPRAEPPGDAPRRQVRLRHAIPETYGVAIAVVLVASLLGVTWVAGSMLRERVAQAEREFAAAMARSIAACLTAERDYDDDALQGAFGRLATDSRLRSIRWIGLDGKERFRWAKPAAQSADPEPSGGVLTETAELRAPDGRPDGVVAIELNRDTLRAQHTILLGSCAAAIIVSLLGYLLIYRRLRRHAQPLAAIQNNLESYVHGTERELVALSLSDSLGQIADCWNSFLDEMVQLRNQAGSHTAPSADGDAITRFEVKGLRSALDRLPVGVVRVDAECCVKYVNSVGARLLGHEADDLIGKYIGDLFDEDIARPLLLAHQNNTKSRAVDWRTSEEPEAATVRLQMLPGSGSGRDDYLLFMQDVTHDVQADRARDEFLYHITHELRTPLTNIQAYAETLTRPDFDDEQTRKESYNVIISETRRLSHLVEDVLSLSQLEVGSLRIQWGDVDLIRLLRSMVQDNLGAADNKQIELTLKLPPKAPQIRGDKHRLAVLLNNLIGNAIKYTPEGGRVDVALSTDDSHVFVTVHDTGIGISPEDQERIFEKFYRVSSEEVQSIVGTGLGLAIAREIVRLHGGDITLQSEPGAGSTFTVKLPFNAEKLP